MTDHAEHMLRQFVAARRAGDDAAARHWWEQLVTSNFGRVRNWVKLASRGHHLSPTEQDEALQQALIKLVNNMIHTFEGTTMGEWVNATKTLVGFACIDVQRSAASTSKKSAPLYGTGDGGEETDHLNSGVHRAIERHHAEQEADDRAADTMAERATFLDHALPKLTDKRRAVIELDRQGVPNEEIERRLGMSRDAVYQSRSRAMKDLERLREEHPS